jgi:hypothetical protein
VNGTTEEETLASRGNGQYEPYLVVSKDEADARVDALEAENEKLKQALAVALPRTGRCRARAANPAYQRDTDRAKSGLGISGRATTATCSR